MAAKKAKLQDQFSNDATKEEKNHTTTTLFNGISIFVNGYTSMGSTF
jgi:sRNA-binding regulator protein Hfq